MLLKPEWRTNGMFHDFAASALGGFRIADRYAAAAAVLLAFIKVCQNAKKITLPISGAYDVMGS